MYVSDQKEVNVCFAVNGGVAIITRARLLIARAITSPKMVGQGPDMI